MKVREKTKKKIADSVVELIKKKPLDKVTITDITANCDMTRQIFYRYFIDKYDLINWIYEQDCDEAIFSNGKEFKWEDMILHLLEIFKEKSNFYFHAIKSEDENSLEKMILNRCIFYNQRIIEYRTGDKLNDEMDFLIKQNCYGTVYMMISEIKQGMQRSTEKIAEWILKGTPKQIGDLILEYPISMNIVKQWTKEK